MYIITGISSCIYIYIYIYIIDHYIIYINTQILLYCTLYNTFLVFQIIHTSTFLNQHYSPMGTRIAREKFLSSYMHIVYNGV